MENEVEEHDYVRTTQGSLSGKDTPRYKSGTVPNLGGEGLRAIDPPRIMNTFREVQNNISPTLDEIESTRRNVRRNTKSKDKAWFLCPWGGFASQESQWNCNYFQKYN